MTPLVVPSSNNQQVLIKKSKPDLKPDLKLEPRGLNFQTIEEINEYHREAESREEAERLANKLISNKLIKEEKVKIKLLHFPEALENFNKSLNACGKLAKHSVYCVSCENEGQQDHALLGVTKKIHICEVRYCSKPLCVSQRYASVMESFENVKRLEDLKKLRHFSVGFEKVSKYDFENNFDKIKKKQERVLHVYFNTLKKGSCLPYEFRNQKNLTVVHEQDIQNQLYIKKYPNKVFFKPLRIQGFKVLDISKGKREEVILKSYKTNRSNSFYLKLSKKEFNFMFPNGKLERFGIKYKIVKWDKHYFIHFHFAIIPFKKGGREVTTMKAVEQMIVKGQRKKIPFVYEDYGNKDKKAILSYLALRLIGLHKKYETEKEEIKNNPDFYNAKDIRKSLHAGKWMTLDKIITPEQYFKHFFRRRNLSTIGNSYFCFKCSHTIPLRTDGKPTYVKGEEKICPHCGSNEVKMALPKSLQGTNSAITVNQVSCMYHGDFNINDFFNLRHVFEILEDPPPPDLQLKKRQKPVFILVNATRFQTLDTDGNVLRTRINKKFLNHVIPATKKEPAMVVKTIKIVRPFCKSCFKEYDSDDMQNSNTCKFCFNQPQRDREHHIRKVSRWVSAKDKDFNPNDPRLINFEDRIKLATTGKC